MISLAPGTKVYLACRPVDLRNGFDGLAAKAQQMIGADPFSGLAQYLYNVLVNSPRAMIGLGF